MIELGPLFSSAVSSGLPIALWRLPGGDRIQGMIELSETVSTTRIRLERDDNGFALSPFVNPEGKETLFLRGDLCFETSADEMIERLGFRGNPEKENRKKRFLELVNRLTGSKREKAPQWHNRSVAPTTQSEKEHYCQLVAKGILAIKNKDFRKLVYPARKLSRSRKILISSERMKRFPGNTRRLLVTCFQSRRLEPGWAQPLKSWSAGPRTICFIP